MKYLLLAYQNMLQRVLANPAAPIPSSGSAGLDNSMQQIFTIVFVVCIFICVIFGLLAFMKLASSSKRSAAKEDLPYIGLALAGIASISGIVAFVMAFQLF